MRSLRTFRVSLYRRRLASEGRSYSGERVDENKNENNSNKGKPVRRDHRCGVRGWDQGRQAGAQGARVHYHAGSQNNFMENSKAVLLYTYEYSSFVQTERYWFVLQQVQTKRATRC